MSSPPHHHPGPRTPAGRALQAALLIMGLLCVLLITAFTAWLIYAVASVWLTRFLGAT